MPYEFGLTPHSHVEEYFACGICEEVLMTQRISQCISQRSYNFHPPPCFAGGVCTHLIGRSFSLHHMMLMSKSGHASHTHTMDSRLTNLFALASKSHPQYGMIESPANRERACNWTLGQDLGIVDHVWLHHFAHCLLFAVLQRVAACGFHRKKKNLGVSMPLSHGKLFNTPLVFSFALISDTSAPAAYFCRMEITRSMPQ